MITRRAGRIGCLLVLLGLAAHPAQGQTILMPGEARANIPAAGRVLTVQGNEFADFRSWAEVKFDRPDAFAQNIRLEASHPARYFPVYGTAVARGMLFVDFCVPAVGAASGCGSEPAVPDVISATLSFGYSIVGSVGSFGFTAEATLQVMASVLDVAEQAYILKDDLLSLTAQGEIKFVKEVVPIPLPDNDDATETHPVTYSLILKRGRLYRFQLAALATSTKGLVQSPGSLFYAYSDFSRPVQGVNSPPDGFVQLRNLTISVTPDTSSLQFDIVRSLQEQINRLVDQVDRLRSEHQNDVAALRERLGDLRLATIGPGSDMCTSIPPGQDWICANGGWVPPGHPSAIGGSSFPVPASSPPAPVSPPPPACTSPMPAPTWVCVNGGWVPPDHPLARGGG